MVTKTLYSIDASRPEDIECRLYVDNRGHLEDLQWIRQRQPEEIGNGDAQDNRSAHQSQIAEEDKCQPKKEADTNGNSCARGR